MTIELTPSEAKTLLFYLDKARIDAEGMVAIGFGNPTSARNIKTIIHKIKNSELKGE